MFRILLLLFLFVSPAVKVTPPAPFGPLPSQRQINWNDMEFYAFIHFNMNTFTNMEWGMGSEKPSQFNPTQLDCRQWARVCSEAGMKGIILTAKHHDGFCLWPSAYTEHSVKNSPWRNGKGDVVRELSEACKEYGLKLGIYLSPWDRNHAEYGKPEYLAYFRNQLRELLTNYGDIFEIWFDGANGGTGWYGGANEERHIDRKTYYDWQNTYKIVRELQPGACLFSDAGPDIRWVGNEEGWAMETNWSTIRRDEFYPGSPNYVELRTGHEDGTHWVPAEVDVSIRPGWYYHPSEDHLVKTLPHLLDIYYNSVGRNASLLINFPVDKRGLIHENDAAQILKLGKAIKADFAENLVSGKKIAVSNVRGNSKEFGPKNLIDNNKDTYWATDDHITQPTLTVKFDKPTVFNRFMISENIKLGQRVKKFEIEALCNGKWKPLASQTTIGRKRILRFPDTEATQFRLKITESKACPVISELGLYHAPKILVNPLIIRNREGLADIKPFDSGLEIFYTTDGSAPTAKSQKFSAPFEFKGKGVVKAIAFDPDSGNSSEATTTEFDICSCKWKFGDSSPLSEKAIDGNAETAFNVKGKSPADFDTDLGEILNIKGFTYLPNQGRWNPGYIERFDFWVSTDGKNWQKIIQDDEFSNIANSPILQKKEFNPVKARYLRLTALSTVNKDESPGIAEFGIITSN